MVFPYVKTFYVQPSLYSISNAVLPLTFFSFRDQSAFVMLHYARYFNGVQLEEPLNKVCFYPVDKTQAQVLFCINMVHFCITTMFFGPFIFPLVAMQEKIPSLRHSLLFDMLGMEGNVAVPPESVMHCLVK